VRYHAATTLGQMGEAAAQHPAVIPRLLKALQDEYAGVFAAKALERLMAHGVRIFKDRYGRWEWHSVAELSRGGPDLPTALQ